MKLARILWVLAIIHGVLFTGGCVLPVAEGYTILFHMAFNSGHFYSGPHLIQRSLAGNTWRMTPPYAGMTFDGTIFPECITDEARHQLDSIGGGYVYIKCWKLYWWDPDRWVIVNVSTKPPSDHGFREIKWPPPQNGGGR